MTPCPDCQSTYPGFHWDACSLDTHLYRTPTVRDSLTLRTLRVLDALAPALALTLLLSIMVASVTLAR